MTSWTLLATEDKINIIKRVYANSEKTATKIADDISAKIGEQITRNAIIGIYSRNRDDLWKFPLMGRGDAHIRREDYADPKPKREPKVKDAARPERPEPAIKEKAIIAPRIRREIPAAPPRMLNLTVMELDGNTCRFPTTGTGADMLSCGLETEGRTYCPYHSAIAYRPRAKVDRGEYVPQVAG